MKNKTFFLGYSSLNVIRGSRSWSINNIVHLFCSRLKCRDAGSSDRGVFEAMEESIGSMFIHCWSPVAWGFSGGLSSILGGSGTQKYPHNLGSLIILQRLVEGRGQICWFQDCQGPRQSLWSLDIVQQLVERRGRPADFKTALRGTALKHTTSLFTAVDAIWSQPSTSSRLESHSEALHELLHSCGLDLKPT